MLEREVLRKGDGNLNLKAQLVFKQHQKCQSWHIMEREVWETHVSEFDECANVRRRKTGLEESNAK